MLNGVVFAESEFGEALENESCLGKWLMKPYPGKFLSEEKKIFNYRLSRARQLIKNAFAIAAAGWRVLTKPV